MAWSDAARQAALEARRANAQSGGVTHQRGIGAVGQPGLSANVLGMIRKAHEGISVRPDGSQPTGGYMVSLPGHSQVLNGHELLGHNANHLLDDYARRHADALRDPRAHIGVWKDHGSGKVYLDISQNMSGKFQAIHAGKARNQIAIFDVKRKREIKTGGTGA